MGRRLLTACIFLLFAVSAHAGEFRVVFLSPGGETGFWGDVAKTMSAAAQDFDVDLEILYADRKPYAMEEMLHERLGRGDHPDYFVLVNENQAGARLVQQMAGTSSKVIFMLNKLTMKQREILERRGFDLTKIIAGIEPDNETAGYEMAQSLFERARQLDPERGEIRLLALTGDTSTPAGLNRELGMQRAVADNPDVRLVHAIPVAWNETTAYRRTREVLKRGQLDVIWGANDDIALGARKAAMEAGLVPGKDILFSGLNWSARGMNAVRDGTMTMTHGGHFFAGAWSMVLLRDHFHKTVRGEMFVDVLFKMSPITIDNVNLYLERLGDGNWERIDFSTFSKSGSDHNHYDFSAGTILQAASGQHPF